MADSEAAVGRRFGDALLEFGQALFAQNVFQGRFLVHASQRIAQEADVIDVATFALDGLRNQNRASLEIAVGVGVDVLQKRFKARGVTGTDMHGDAAAIRQPI